MVARVCRGTVVNCQRDTLPVQLSDLLMINALSSGSVGCEHAGDELNDFGRETMRYLHRNSIPNSS